MMLEPFLILFAAHCLVHGLRAWKPDLAFLGAARA
jgi:hypothetical protein